MQIKHIEAEDMKKEMNEVQMRKYAEYDDIRSSVSHLLKSRVLVVVGAEGAAAPVNFEQWVHAPINFQPF